MHSLARIAADAVTGSQSPGGESSQPKVDVRSRSPATANGTTGTGGTNVFSSGGRVIRRMD